MKVKQWIKGKWQQFLQWRNRVETLKTQIKSQEVELESLKENTKLLEQHRDWLADEIKKYQLDIITAANKIEKEREEHKAQLRVLEIKNTFLEARIKKG